METQIKESAAAGGISPDFLEKFSAFLASACSSQQKNQIAVDEHACATSIGMSIHFLRKDRKGKRLIPFFMVGGAVRYNLDRVREALNALEQGGEYLRPRSRRTSTANK